jgi:ATP-dependent Clp protease ATP-binding subunit ClpB
MENAPFASVERTVLMRVRDRLRPELLGRINEVIVFARLLYGRQREICMDLIAAECARLVALGHAIEVGSDAIEFLVREGYHRSLGARPMRGAAERHLQDAISMDVIDGRSGNGRLIVAPHVQRLCFSE